MNFLQGFINFGTDNALLKALANKAGLVPKQVQVNGKHGTYTATRMVNPNQNDSKNYNTQPKESMRAMYERKLVGFQTNNGTTIKGFDKAHFFRRVSERHVRANDIRDTLREPKYTYPGKNAAGSTVYVGEKVTVVVVDGGFNNGDGILKTCWMNND